MFFLGFVEKEGVLREVSEDVDGAVHAGQEECRKSSL